MSGGQHSLVVRRPLLALPRRVPLLVVEGGLQARGTWGEGAHVSSCHGAHEQWRTRIEDILPPADPPQDARNVPAVPAPREARQPSQAVPLPTSSIRFLYLSMSEVVRTSRMANTQMCSSTLPMKLFCWSSRPTPATARVGRARGLRKSVRRAGGASADNHGRGQRWSV